MAPLPITRLIEVGDRPRSGRGDAATTASNVLVAALRLSAEDRAAVAAALIQSLDEPEQTTEEVEAAWAEEIQQRLADVDAEVVTPVPWPEARRRILAAANGRREAP
ncbi:addiction module protein [Sorangium sp. So ce834]|uniref:addiction module protein n=1 Tax=Sorangium sp. So ce834 TaxID=3133321 RepID=UPI003F61A7AA